MKSLNTLAIVEDDVVLREELSYFFASHGYAVQEANCHQGLLDILKFHDIQVVVLDLNLPGKSGYEIATSLKKNLPQLGIVMLTARTTLADRIKGYEMGADIYLPKPTDPMELLAAIRSLIKRLEDAVDKPPAFELSLREHRLASPQTCCRNLTAVEMFLLRVLAVSPQQTLDEGQLLDVLDEKFTERALTRRALENILSRLRKKLMICFDAEIDPIKAVRGFGYQLTWDIKIVD